MTGPTSLRRTPLNFILGMRRVLDNWPSVLSFLWLAMPNRLSFHHGVSRLASRPVRLRLRCGMSLVCRADEVYGFYEVFVEKAYEDYRIPWDRTSLIADVGANAGAATLWFALRAPKARIVAVEPNPDVADRLRRNVRRNGLSERVQVVEAALGRASGFGRLIAAETPMSMRVTANASPGSGDVRIVTLRELFEETGNERVDVLKLDCEGAEFDIIRGEPNLREKARFVIGEWHASAGSFQEICSLLTSRGYAVTAEPPQSAQTTGLFRARAN